MLKITNDGRKLALDQRLVNELLPDNPESKIAVCAEKSYEIWKDTACKHPEHNGEDFPILLLIKAIRLNIIEYPHNTA